MAETKMMGTVKWFSARRGYGFITDGEGVDHYAHFSEIQMEGFRKLTEGQSVSFRVKEDASGREMATEIQVLDMPAEMEE